MKANELRIGNYTKVKDMNCVVCSFYENGVHIGLGKCFHFQELEPIELTEEWLLRLGFTMYRGGAEIDGFLVNKVINPVQYYHINTELKYVHQLQNLYFALTGEELTIK